MEYRVDLLKSTVKELSVSVNVDEESKFQIDSGNTASVFEPTNETDPTVLIRSECTMRDNATNKLSIGMKAEFIFKFDPLPENRTAVASEYCPEIIAKEFNRIAVDILKDMGHQFKIE